MASRFWVLGTGTWDASDTTHWAATSGGAPLASVPGSSDSVTFDANSGGGTVTVNTTVGITTLTMGAFTGTLDFSANNNNVTLSGDASFSGTGTGTRTLNLGNGTWTIQGRFGNVWDLTTVTNLTFNANSSTLVFTAATNLNQRTFASGGKTYNIVSATGSAATAFVISGSPTIATLNFTAPMYIVFANATTTTITNAINWAGTAYNAAFVITTDVTGSTISSGVAGTIAWAAINGITFSGAGSLVATNSFDIRNNSNITITGPGGGGMRLAGRGGLASGA